MPDQVSHLDAYDIDVDLVVELDVFVSTPIDEDGIFPVTPVDPPVVALVSPVSPAEVGRDSVIDLTITGATLKTIVWIEFTALGLTEVVWDGAAFTQLYASSTFASNAMRIRRGSPWPASPTLRVFAAAGGAETTP